MTDHFSGVPSSIRAGPYDVVFEIVDNPNDSDDDHVTWGRWRSTKLTVQVNREQPSSIFAVGTMLHELLHVAWSLNSIGHEDIEERIVSSLSDYLIQVFRDNPTLLAWISTRLHPPCSLRDRTVHRRLPKGRVAANRRSRSVRNPSLGKQSRRNHGVASRRAPAKIGRRK